MFFAHFCAGLILVTSLFSVNSYGYYYNNYNNYNNAAAITGAIIGAAVLIGTAAAIPGTLVNLAAGGGEKAAVRFGHPSGTLRVGAQSVILTSHHASPDPARPAS